MEQTTAVFFFPSVCAYLRQIPDTDSGVVARDIRELAIGATADIRTKQLRGPIRELIVGNHRVTYFRLHNTLYCVRAFRKKTAKTPLREIEETEKAYTFLSSSWRN